MSTVPARQHPIPQLIPRSPQTSKLVTNHTQQPQHALHAPSNTSSKSHISQSPTLHTPSTTASNPLKRKMDLNSQLQSAAASFHLGSLGMDVTTLSHFDDHHRLDNDRPIKKTRTNTPWSPEEEKRLKELRDVGTSWSEIAKSFPNRTEGSVKKHWYKDMHYAEFSEEEKNALFDAIRDYDANKWKYIGTKVGKPAKACEQFARENFNGR